MISMKKLTTTGSGLLMLAIAIVAINVIASRTSFRFDVTGEKVFSLSSGTKSILEKLPGEVNAKLYFSRSMKELPVPIKTYATRVEEVLGEYAAKSGGKIKLEVLDPKPDTDEEEWAQKYGITGVRLPRGDAMYFGVVFLIGAKEIVVPYLDPRREEFLEYDLSEALVRAFRKDTPTVAVMSSLPVMGGGPAMMQGGEGAGEPWIFVNELKRNFTVKEASETATQIDDDVKVLLLIHPKALSDATLYAIDQFVLSGGRLIVAVDPMSRIDLQSGGAAARAAGQMPTIASDLDKLFKAWGLEYDKGSVVGDATMATQINANGVVSNYPLFLTVPEKAFQTTSPVTANLKQMMLGEAGGLSLKDGTKDVSFEPLIKTGPDSGLVNAQMVGFMMPQDLAKEVKFDGKERILAGILKGKFKTAFPGGKPAAASKPGEKPEEAPSALKPHVAASAEDSAVIVIADTDFIADQNAAEKFRFGAQVMVRARNDNLNFIANAADFLGGSQDLISIRSHGRIARPFTRIQEIQVGAEKRWQAEEETLTKQLNDLQKKLNELQQQRTDGNRLALTAEQQAEIDRFRSEEKDVKTRRREVRKNLREDIEHLGNRLTALNLLILPLASTAFGASVSVRRGRKAKKRA